MILDNHHVSGFASGCRYTKKMHLSRFSTGLGQGHQHRAWTVLTFVRGGVGHDETLFALAGVTMSGKDLDALLGEFVGLMARKVGGFILGSIDRYLRKCYPENREGGGDVVLSNTISRATG